MILPSGASISPFWVVRNMRRGSSTTPSPWHGRRRAFRRARCGMADRRPSLLQRPPPPPHSPTTKLDTRLAAEADMAWHGLARLGTAWHTPERCALPSPSGPHAHRPQRATHKQHRLLIEGCTRPFQADPWCALAPLSQVRIETESPRPRAHDLAPMPPPSVCFHASKIGALVLHLQHQ